MKTTYFYRLYKKCKLELKRVTILALQCEYIVNLTEVYSHDVSCQVLNYIVLDKGPYIFINLFNKLFLRETWAQSEVTITCFSCHHCLCHNQWTLTKQLWRLKKLGQLSQNCSKEGKMQWWARSKTIAPLMAALDKQHSK